MGSSTKSTTTNTNKQSAVPTTNPWTSTLRSKWKIAGTWEWRPGNISWSLVASAPKIRHLKRWSTWQFSTTAIRSLHSSYCRCIRWRASSRKLCLSVRSTRTSKSWTTLDHMRSPWDLFYTVQARNVRTCGRTSTQRSAPSLLMRPNSTTSKTSTNQKQSLLCVDSLVQLLTSHMRSRNCSMLATWKA